MINKNTYISILVVIYTSFFSVLNWADQGDVPGSFNVSLNEIYQWWGGKSCIYRSDIQVLNDDSSLYGSNMIYGILMSTGVIERVIGRPSWIRDARGYDKIDPIKIYYEKTKIGRSDCPNNLTMIYNSLTQEIREQ